jgi:hypothetical protein
MVRVHFDPLYIYVVELFLYVDSDHLEQVERGSMGERKKRRDPALLFFNSCLPIRQRSTFVSGFSANFFPRS